MTSETLAKSLESERKSGQGTAIAIILVVLVIFGVYWFAVRASTQEDAEKQIDPDEDGHHPTEEDYEYMDDDDFDDEDDIDDEDYDLLEEEDDLDDGEEEDDLDDGTEAEEDDDVRISELFNETQM